MRRLALAALVVTVLAACGGAAPRGAASPGRGTSPTPSASAVTPEPSPGWIWPATTPRSEPASTPRTEPPSTPPTAAPPPCVVQGSIAPRSKLAITAPAPRAPVSSLGVSVSSPGMWLSFGHTIVVFDTSGATVAKVDTAPRTHLRCGGSELQDLPIVTTSASRVFYLDGDNTIRYLNPDGTAGTVGSVTIPALGRAMIAVSPDESQLAVATYDMELLPPVERISVIDLATGAETLLATNTASYFYLVGWRAGKIVGGFGDTPGAHYGFYAPYGLFDHPLQTLDPATRLFTPVGPDVCSPVSSLASSAGYVCRAQDSSLMVQRWSGERVALAGAASSEASLSPDGSLVAVCCYEGGNMRILPALGPSSVTPAARQTPGYAGDGGWIDASHVVYRVPGSGIQAIYDVTTGNVTQRAVAEESGLASGYVLVARLPGGL